MDSPDPILGTNTGLSTRYTRTKHGKEVDLEGPLFVDILQQDRVLLDGVPIEIQLFPHMDVFALMAKEDAGKYKFEITDAVLIVLHKTMSPAIMLAHADTLKEKNALYPYMRSDVKAFNLPTGSYTWSADAIFQDSVPSHMLVALVSASGYSGHYQKNPFNFANMNLTYLDFQVQGRSRPGQPYQPNYPNNNYVSAYKKFDEKLPQWRENLLAWNCFDRGYAIYMFDLDMEGTLPVIRKGHTRIVLKLGEALTEPATLLVYGQFPAMMEIDQARSVTVDDP